MLNTLQDKFRTERVHAHDDYLKLVHTQQLAKLSMTQMVTAFDAQKTEASNLRTEAVADAAEAKNKARDAKVLLDVQQQALSDREVAHSTEADAFEDSKERFKQCKKEVNELQGVVESQIAAAGKQGTCEGDDCSGKDEQACKDASADGCSWKPPNGLLFVQLSTTNDRAHAMELLQRAGRHMGDDTFVSLVQQAPNPVANANGAEKDYGTWVQDIICPSIQTLITSRVGCDPSGSNCVLADQANLHCNSNTCVKVGTTTRDCPSFRTTATCTAAANNSECEMSGSQTCENDLLNIAEELGYIEGDISSLEDDASLLTNNVAIKDRDIELKRECITRATQSEQAAQIELDEATAAYERDIATTRDMIGNANQVMGQLTRGWATDSSNSDSTAGQLMDKLQGAQTSLQLQFATLEQNMDVYTTTHADAVRSERTTKRVCEKELEFLEMEVVQLELSRVGVSKTLGNTKAVYAKTEKMQEILTRQCSGAGGRIPQCIKEFSQGVEDLDNAYNILSCQ